MMLRSNLRLSKSICTLVLFFAAQAVSGASFVNTNGSDEGIAISGYDSVAFFTEKKAIKGTRENTLEWMGAKWLFFSHANLSLFEASPEKYAPQYGGHCFYGASEGYISKKQANGMFEIMNGKLYLFPDGNSSAMGAYNGWWRSGGGPSRRIEAGDMHWPKLRAALEAQ